MCLCADNSPGHVTRIPFLVSMSRSSSCAPLSFIIRWNNDREMVAEICPHPQVVHWLLFSSKAPSLVLLWYLMLKECGSTQTGGDIKQAHRRCYHFTACVKKKRGSEFQRKEGCVANGGGGMLLLLFVVFFVSSSSGVCWSRSCSQPFSLMSKSSLGAVGEGVGLKGQAQSSGRGARHRVVALLGVTVYIMGWTGNWSRGKGVAQ